MVATHLEHEKHGTLDLSQLADSPYLLQRLRRNRVDAEHDRVDLLVNEELRQLFRQGKPVGIHREGHAGSFRLHDMVA